MDEFPDNRPENRTGRVNDMLRCLKHRMLTETDEKQRRIHNRRYALFCNLVHLIYKGTSKENAIRIIAVKLGVSEKTIKRDIAEIRDLLKREGVL